MPSNADRDMPAAAPPRRCNICGASEFSLMARGLAGLNVVRCDTCGLGVVERNPEPPETACNDADCSSGKVSEVSGYGDRNCIADHDLAWAAELVQLIKPGGSILDIGCMDGRLLAKLPDQFERFGTEVNPEMARRAEKIGIRILADDLLDPTGFDGFRGRFDAIICIGVFTHLPDLRRGMQVALDLLKPDGILLFEVPYVSAEHDNRIWFENSSERVYYPSRSCLMRLVEDLDAEFVGQELYIQDFASTYIGIAYRDRSLATRLRRLLAALTSTDDRPLSTEERRVRQSLMLFHAAQGTPALIGGLGMLPKRAVIRPLLQRIEQLWSNDLHRLTQAMQSHTSMQRRSVGFDVMLAIQQEAKAGLQLEVDELHRQLERLRCDEREAAMRAEAMNARCEEMLQTQVTLRAEYEAVIGSSAWKATFPFRRIGARCPGAARLIRRLMKLAWWSVRLQLRSHLRSAVEARRIVRPPAPDLLPQSDAGTTESLAPATTVTETEQRPPMPALQFCQRTGIPPDLNEDDELDPWPEDRPLVSVVITSFNYGHYLATAVDSVLAQTFADLEVIVIEGGSTDPESRHLALSLQRSRTRVIAQSEPTFAGANRNTGISLARGKYICCLDPDDLLLPTYIEKAVFLLESSDFDVVSSSLRFIGDETGTHTLAPTPTLADMLDGNYIMTCAVFRRCLWRRAGGFRDTDRTTTGPFHEDWLFWTRLAALGAKLHNIARDHLFLYRRHGANLSDRVCMPYEQQKDLVRQSIADLIPLGRELQSLRPNWARQVSASALLRPSLLPQRRPVLLLALPFAVLGGAEKLLSAVLAHCRSQGWELLIVTSLDPGTQQGDSTSWFEPTTKAIYHLPRFLDPARWPDFVRYLIASRRADVLWVVGSSFMYELLPRLRIEFPDLRVADLLFNTVGHTANNRRYSRLIDLTFVENREVLRFLLDAGERPDRIALIASGIDVAAYAPGPRDPNVAKQVDVASDELIIGFSGRWSEEKAPLAFIQIARNSLDMPVRFVMTGTGPMRNEIEAMLSADPLPPGRFLLAGEVEDVIPYLRSYDLLLLPSFIDGRPVVVIESLALGVPVVASRVGALPELITDGVNGFICPPGDVSAFTAAIEKVVSDRTLLARMKAGARAYATEHLNAAPMLAAYEASLRALADSQEHPSGRPCDCSPPTADF